MNLNSATMPELVQFFNKNSDKKVKRFSDRKNAMKRCKKLLSGLKKEKVNSMSDLGINIIERSKRFVDGSRRHQCFGLIHEGMTVEDYLTVTTMKLNITRSQALGCLNKMKHDGTVEVK